MARKLFLTCSFFAVLLLVLSFASAAPEESVEGRKQKDPENAPQEIPEAIHQDEANQTNTGDWKRQMNGSKEKSSFQKNGADAGHGQKSSESAHGGAESAGAKKAEFGAHLNQHETNFVEHLNVCGLCKNLILYILCVAVSCKQDGNICSFVSCDYNCFASHCIDLNLYCNV